MRKIGLLFIVIAFISIVTDSNAFQNLTSKNFKSDKEKSYQDLLGIKVESIRLSAYGKIIDFRYRVIDEKKAAPIFSPKVKPYIIDTETGEKCYIPHTPKVGSLRSFGTPVKGRVYFMLFSNTAQLKRGSKVNMVIQDVIIRNLVIE